jgi:hypothetical protein
MWATRCARSRRGGESGVKLGLEDTISAEDNVRIMERSKSPAFSPTTTWGTPPKPASTS